MSLANLLGQLRIDLHDENPADERWADATLEQHITHAVAEYSRSLPLETLGYLLAVNGSREVDLTPLVDRIAVNAVEYPSDNDPKTYERFSIWSNTLTMVDAYLPSFDEICSTTTATMAFELLDNIQDFSLDDIGKFVFNTTDSTYAIVTSLISPIQLGLDTDIMTVGEYYRLAPIEQRMIIYYCIPHTVDDLGSHTIPNDHDHLVLSGAAGFALVEWANYAINRVNVGGGYTAKNYLEQALEILVQFRKVLKALSKQNAVRIRQLYTPYQPPQSKTRVIGP